MKKSDEQERNIANRLYNLDKKVYRDNRQYFRTCLSFQSIIRIRENY